MSGRQWNLSAEERARIAENDAVSVEAGRQLLCAVRAGKVSPGAFRGIRERQLDFAVIRWLKQPANFGFVSGGRFNSVMRGS